MLRSVSRLALCEGFVRSCTVCGVVQQSSLAAPKSDSLGTVINDALEEMQKSGTLKQERVLTSAQGPWISAILSFSRTP